MQVETEPLATGHQQGKISLVQLYCLRYPLAHPIKTVMGEWASRPAILVRVEDQDGAFGWGEIWCNFPPHGAEYRTRLAALTLKKALEVVDICRPFETFRKLRNRLHILSLQAGETGPADAIASGVDIAVHDLIARKNGVSLTRHLGGNTQVIKVYASGMDSRDRERLVDQARESGFKTFKLRVGFGLESDLAAIRSLNELIHDDESIALDANQSWSVEAINSMSNALHQARPAWVEEPLPVDSSASVWSEAARLIGCPVSGGENMRSHSEFDEAICGSVFQIIQPDICKWGGLSEVHSIARRTADAGKQYLPHFLGSGLGLVASAHMLAALNPSGMLETDVNENGLRELLAGDVLKIDDGRVRIPSSAGLGIAPERETFRQYETIYEEINLT